MRKGAQSYVCAKDADVVMTFLDISRAHSHVEVKRTLHMELLEKHPEHHNDQVGKLLRHCMTVLSCTIILGHR